MLEEFGKMSIRKLGPLADLVLLLLRLGLGRHAMNLRSSPPLSSVCSRFHPILLKIPLNIKHITGELNPPKQLFQIVINSDICFGIIWVCYVLLRIKIR